MTFDCPRCHEPTEAKFYGPCNACRSSLRSASAADLGAVVDPCYPLESTLDGRERRGFKPKADCPVHGWQVQ